MNSSPQAVPNKTRLPLVVINAIKFCKREQFHAFIGATDEADAKAKMCERLQIKSRKELATNKAALRRFHELVGKYNNYLFLKKNDTGPAVK